MPRDERAFLADVVESCEAIQVATSGLDLAAYSDSRLVRSSVEREFIIIGEAITNARRIVDFRNQLTHSYPTVDDALVWAIVERDVPLLREQCSRLLHEASPEEERG